MAVGSFFISSQIAGRDGDSSLRAMNRRDAAKNSHDNNDGDNDDDESERDTEPPIERRTNGTHDETRDALYIPDSACTHPTIPVTRVPHYIHDGPPGTRHYYLATGSETGNRAIHTQKSRHVRKILTPH